jgi:hypothetical protein
LKHLALEEQTESHFAANYRFHKESGMALNELDFYAQPFGAVVRAVNIVCAGGMTREQAHQGDGQGDQ